MPIVSIHDQHSEEGIAICVAVLAATLVRSPRKLIILIQRENIFWLQVSQKHFVQNVSAIPKNDFKTKALIAIVGAVVLF